MEGLQPSTEYAVTVEIDLATNVPGGLFGIGGSPGESVFVKAGASAIEPSQEQDASGWLRSNIDKGNQANEGTEMVVVGNVSHPDVVGDEYKIKPLTNEQSPLSVTTDANGGVWLIVGTDSGFEGLTALLLYKDKLQPRGRPGTRDGDGHRYDYLPRAHRADPKRRGRGQASRCFTGGRARHYRW